jgi:hypothetical protein
MESQNQKEEIVKIQKKLFELDTKINKINSVIDKDKTKNKKHNSEEFDLNRVSEKAYKRTFWLMVFIVLGATIGNSLARWLLDRPDLELIPSNVFGFIKDVAYIFVIPVSIKIVGDKLPLMIEAFKLAKEMRKDIKNDLQDDDNNNEDYNYRQGNDLSSNNDPNSNSNGPSANF